VIGTMNFFGTGEKTHVSFVEQISKIFDSVTICTMGPKPDQRWYDRKYFGDAIAFDCLLRCAVARRSRWGLTKTQ
jgi:hypothetical protein